MNVYYSRIEADPLDCSKEETWNRLYPLLRSIARQCVYTFPLPSWRGQEEDIIQDVIQETARRTFEYTQKAARGEVSPIHSLKALMQVIAQNYCNDLRRHDRWLVRFPQDHRLFDVQTSPNEREHLLEVATENVYREALFAEIAREVIQFPPKQQQALLIDIAKEESTVGQSTVLQKAFLKKGIQLQHYQHLILCNPKERSRQSSLLNHARRRIAQLPEVRKYRCET